MAWTTGTATDHKDLLDKIVDFAVLNGWTLHASSIGAGAEDFDVYQISGPGSDVNADVHLNLRTRTELATNTTWIECRGSILYDANLAWDNQPGGGPGSFLIIWPFAMQYWLSVSDRRIALTVQVNAEYYSMYAGFFLPFATPVEYPYPLMTVASFDSAINYTAQRSDIRAMSDPGAGGWVREPDGTWVQLRNHTTGVSTVDNFSRHYPDGYYAFPYFSGNINNSPMQALDLRPPPADEDRRTIMPIYLQGASEFSSFIGVYEGVFWIKGFGLGTEQEFSIGANDYIIFQNRQKTANWHYYAQEQA